MIFQRGNYVGRSFVVGALFVIALFCSAMTAHAQLPTGTILGVIKDSSGAVVPGADVTVTRVDTGVSRTIKTVADGSYRFSALPVGTYEVQASATGFETQNRKGLVLEVTQQAVVDFSLSVGLQTQSVTITADIPLVNTTSSSIGSTVTQQSVSDLPLNGRNFTDLTLLQPGITQSHALGSGVSTGGMNGTEYSSNGATLHSNLILLDGAITNNAFGLNNSSINGTSLGVDGIKEYRVVTNTFSAEYGIAAGSQSTIVSKSGTNQFHGTAFEYLRNSALDARNYFDFSPVKGGTNPYPGHRLPPFQRNNFGGSVGGPIKKDKTFFFLVYEGLRQNWGQTIATNTLPLACFADLTNTLHAQVPTHINNSATNPYNRIVGGVPQVCAPGGPAALTVAPVMNGTVPGYVGPTDGVVGLFPQPTVPNPAKGQANFSFPFVEPSPENFGQARVDQVFSASDSLFGRFTRDDASAVAPAGQTSFNTASTFPGLVNNFSSTSMFITLSETHIITANLLNTARYSFSRTAYTIGSNYFAPPGNTPPPLDSFTQPGIQAIAGQNIGTYAPGGGVTSFAPNAAPGTTRQNINTFSDDVYWNKGKHAFQFGVLANHFQVPVSEHFLDTGSVSFATLASFFSGVQSSVLASQSPTTTAGNQVPPDQNRRPTYNTLGFYIQDDYKVLSRLTVNLGLRYEFLTTPNYPPGQSYNLLTLTTPNPSDAVAPNFGFVPSPIFKNPTLHDFSPRVGFAWDVTGKGKTSLRGGAGLFYDLTSIGSYIVTQSLATPPLSTLIITPNLTAAPITLPFPLTFSPVVQPSPRIIQYNIGQPQLVQYNLNLQQQLPWQMVFSVGYVGSHGIHLNQAIEGNQTIPCGALAASAGGCPAGTGFDPATGLPIYAVPLGGANTPPSFAACQALATAHTALSPGCKINPFYGQSQFNTAEGESSYNGLQVSLNKRMSNNLQLQVNYVYSKVLDDGGEIITNEGSENIQQPTNFKNGNWGPAVFDATQNLRVNAIYYLPKSGSDGVAGKLLNGWWVSTIVSAQTGYPLTATISGTGVDSTGGRLYGATISNQNNVASADFPDRSPAFSTASTGNPTGWFNLTSFQVPTAGHLGDEGRGALRGPGLANMDFSLVKDTKVGFLGEAGMIQFRTEIFNVFNRANFGPPNLGIAAQTPSISGDTPINTATAGNFGQILSTTTNSRQIQFALKVIF